MKLLVIADDFTGSNDTGVQFAKKGAKVDVSFLWDDKNETDTEVLVIDSETRAVSIDESKRRIKTCIIQQETESRGMTIYKKIDSTLRGNLGAEIEAIFDVTNIRLALVVAAIPNNGRVTKEGICYVNGTPLLETEYATDPKTPIHSSSIKNIIASQTDLPVHEIHLANIRSGNANQLIDIIENKERSIIILDTETEEDLRIIGQAIDNISCPVAFVGAAGLASVLPERFYKERHNKSPALVISGSMSDATIKQINYVVKNSLADVIDIDVDRLLSSDYIQLLTEVVTEASDILKKGHHCIIRSCTDSSARNTIEERCEKLGFSRQELGETISLKLSEITREILQKNSVGGLFLTGGDIAIAVAKTIKAKGYRVQHEVAPCIPCGVLIDSEINNAIPVITKAGGFGAEDAIKVSLEFFGKI